MKHHLHLKYSSILIVILLIITGLLLTACGGAAPKTYTIGILNLSANQETTIKGFKEGLTELGYVEDKNVTYVYQGPVAADKLDEEAQNLVKAKVDLILSVTTPATLAAKKATAGAIIPVVFTSVNNAVEAGVVNSLPHPGGNLTGVTGVAEGKRLEWLLQVVPTIKQVYIVYNPKDPNPVQSLKTVSNSATKLGVTLITREASTTDEAMAAFHNIPQEANAVFVLADSVSTARGSEVFTITNQLKLPSSAPNVAAVESSGALTAYGINMAATAKKQAARLASQIFHGAKPADLPVEMAEFSSALNLKTARTIGIDITDEALRQADTVIR